MIPKHQNYTVIKASASDPDPGTYCPANGYIPDPYIYIPPIPIPEPSSEEIILFCSNEGASLVTVRCIVSSAGQYTVKVYAADGTTLISSVNSNNNTINTYYFPNGALTYYIVKISPTVGGNSITTFYTYNAVGNYSSYDWPILQAKFNTPNMTSLASAFRGVVRLQSCTFSSNMNSLTTMLNMFYAGGLKYFKFPVGLAALTTVQEMFRLNNFIEVVDMKDANMPALTTMYNMMYISSVKQIIWPIIEMTVLNTISQMCYQCYFLEGELIIPEMPALNNATSAFYQCKKLLKVKWDGFFYSMTSTTCWNNTFYQCTGIMEYIYARWHSSNQPSELAQTSVQKLILPDVLIGGYGGTSWMIGQEKYSITGDFDNSGQDQPCYIGMAACTMLYEFNCPKMRCYYFSLGLNTTNYYLPYLTRIDIDWANSSFSFGTQPVLQIAANLDATELNRIMGLLPDGTGKTMKISACSGYAGCDTTIATAKNWTVT